MKVKVQWVLVAIVLTWLLAIGIAAIFGEGEQETLAFSGPSAAMRRIGGDRNFGLYAWEMSYGTKTYLIFGYDRSGLFVIEK